MSGGAVQGCSRSECGTVGRGASQVADQRVGHGDHRQGHIAYIGGYDGVVDHITHCIEVGFRCDLGDGQERVQDSRDIFRSANLCCSPCAIIYASRVSPVTGIQVSLGNGMSGGAVQGCTDSECGAVGRGASQVADQRVGHGDHRQGHIADIGGYDGVVDHITQCIEVGFRCDLGDGQERVLDSRDIFRSANLCCSPCAIIYASRVSPVTGIQVSLGNGMSGGAVQGFIGASAESLAGVQVRLLTSGSVTVTAGRVTLPTLVAMMV